MQHIGNSPSRSNIMTFEEFAKEDIDAEDENICSEKLVREKVNGCMPQGCSNGEVTTATCSRCFERALVECVNLTSFHQYSRFSAFRMLGKEQ